jgi:ADP-ribose pyrophosphatase
MNDGRHVEGPVEDLDEPRPVLGRRDVHHGMVWDVTRDSVDLGRAGTVSREYVRHPGAVCVLALDERERVLLLRQYRHPVGMELWEPPAGLMDVHEEPPLTAAQRELAEEADLRAGRWEVLIDWFNSPGGSDEALRCYLARELSEVPLAERFTRTAEEADMSTRWLPLDEARAAVLDGRIHNPAAVISILAGAASRDRGWAGLLPGDSPWRHWPARRRAGRPAPEGGSVP